MWATIEPVPPGELSRESLSEPLRHIDWKASSKTSPCQRARIRMKEDRGVRDPARSFGFAHVLPASARVATVRPIDWYRFPSRGALLRPRRDHRRNRGGAGGRDHGGKECADGEGARRQGQSERIPFRDPLELCRDQLSATRSCRIDFGVDCCGLRQLVAQDFADLGQRRSVAEHPGSQRIPEQVLTSRPRLGESP